MADYNIYIHSVGTSNVGSSMQTTPWSQRGGDSGATTPWGESSGSGGGKGGGNFTNGLLKTAKFISNPDSIISSALGGVLKAAAVVAVAKTVIDIGLSTWEKHADWYELTTGDSSSKLNAQRVRESINFFFNPIGVAIAEYRRIVQRRNENSKREQERLLLGDSVINSYTNKGI